MELLSATIFFHDYHLLCFIKQLDLFGLGIMFVVNILLKFTIRFHGRVATYNRARKRIKSQYAYFLAHVKCQVEYSRLF